MPVCEIAEFRNYVLKYCRIIAFYCLKLLITPYTYNTDENIIKVSFSSSQI